MAATKAIANWMRQRPVVSYFALAFAISWIGTLLAIGGPGRIPATAEETARLFPAVYLTTVIGPSVAGLAMTALLGGRTGLRELFARLVRWRVGARWYALAILTAPLSVNATLLALSLFSPQFAPAQPSLGTSSLVIFAAGVATGLLEETGWTGFAVPRMLARHGTLLTGLTVGLLWGAWHLVSNVWALPPTGSLQPAVFLLVLLFTFLPPYRILMVWLYERTGSLLLAVIMHASLVTFWLMATPPGIAGDAMSIWYVAWGVVLWAAVAVVAMVRRAAGRPAVAQGGS